MHKEKGLGGFRHTHILYKGIPMDSSWEVKLAKSLDDHGILWVRPKSIQFVDRKGLKRRYLPDFYLPEYDVYLDPKNPYAKLVQKEKLEDIFLYTNIALYILSESELNWNSVKLLLSEKQSRPSP